MKKLHFIAILFFLFSLVSYSTFAGGDKGKCCKKDGKAKIEKLADDLALTGEKKEKFMAIHANFHEKMKASKENKSERKEAIKTKNDELKALLSETEFAQYKEKMEQCKADRKSKKDSCHK